MLEYLCLFDKHISLLLVYPKNLSPRTAPPLEPCKASLSSVLSEAFRSVFIGSRARLSAAAVWKPLRSLLDVVVVLAVVSAPATDFVVDVMGCVEVDDVVDAVVVVFIFLVVEVLLVFTRVFGCIFSFTAFEIFCTCLRFLCGCFLIACNTLPFSFMSAGLWRKP